MNKLRTATAIAAAGPTAWALQHARSPAVNRWVPSSLPGQRFGPLFARSAGDGDRAIVLLHGLISSGDIFGETYDQLARSTRLVIPDLLGFGRSLDEAQTSFSIEDHLDALDLLAEQTGIFERRITIGAHSMGSALALRWAHRHAEQVDRVVCWGAPIYSSPEAARASISGSTMARLFALDTRWAEAACAISCRHRTFAGWLAAAIEPSLPTPITRAASLHTWPAYRDAINELIIETDWAQLLTQLEPGPQTDLFWGTHDRVGDHELARTIATPTANTTTTMIRGADHHLPLTHADICVEHVRDLEIGRIETRHPVPPMAE